MTTTVHEPRQARSQRTMTRILEATESLLEEKRFEQITIQEIVARAGTSVGAFYARFVGKQALLPLLYERYDARFPRDVSELQIEPAANLEERVTQVVARKLQLFVKRRGLLRAMAIHARTHPESIPAEARQNRKRLHRAVNDLIYEFKDEIDHPDPRLAIDIGLFMVSAMFRDKLLYPQAPHASSFEDVEAERLGREMTRALHSYLRGARPRDQEA